MNTLEINDLNGIKYKVVSKTIIYLGKTLKAKRWVELTDNHYNRIVSDFYKKPVMENVVKEFVNLSNGQVKTSNINKFYIKDIMIKTLLHYCKWSVEDALKSKEVMGYFYAGTLENKKMFGDNLSENTKIEKRISLGGKGVASNPKNFPVKTVKNVLDKYNVNNNWYDPSCGWGARLLGAMAKNVNYFGTDPNHLLCDRLINLANDYKSSVINCKSSVEIKTQGSEIFVKEWVNKMGLIFTSPPYFNLEDYKIGKQSYVNGSTYSSWLKTYLTPTIVNSKKYLINEGYIVININNFNEYDLVNDVKDICKNNGLKHIDTMVLENIKRTNSHNGFNNNSEGLMVFKKNQQQLTMF